MHIDTAPHRARRARMRQFQRLLAGHDPARIKAKGEQNIERGSGYLRHDDRCRKRNKLNYVRQMPRMSPGEIFQFVNAATLPFAIVLTAASTIDWGIDRCSVRPRA